MFLDTTFSDDEAQNKPTGSDVGNAPPATHTEEEKAAAASGSSGVSADASNADGGGSQDVAQDSVNPALPEDDDSLQINEITGLCVKVIELETVSGEPISYILR